MPARAFEARSGLTSDTTGRRKEGAWRRRQAYETKADENPREERGMETHSGGAARPSYFTLDRARMLSASTVTH